MDRLEALGNGRFARKRSGGMADGHWLQSQPAVGRSGATDGLCSARTIEGQTTMDRETKQALLTAAVNMQGPERGVWKCWPTPSDTAG